MPKQLPLLQIRLPGNEEIFSLWDKYEMLPNIRRHSLQVCRVALTLWEWLDEAGYHLNRRVVEVGALLHDVAKAYCLDKDIPHNEEGDRIVNEAGYPEMGTMVSRHVNLPYNHPLDEAVLVFYADKRVVGDKIVSVAERYQYIFRVYGRDIPERMRKLQKDEQQSYAVEKQIFSHIPQRRPQDLCTIRRNK